MNKYRTGNRRVKLFHVTLKPTIFEFKSEVEELAKKADGWVENARALTPIKEIMQETRPMSTTSVDPEKKPVKVDGRTARWRK